MHVYHIWCEIYSGPIGVSLNIANPPFKWKLQFDDGTGGTASLFLNLTTNALVVFETPDKVSNTSDLVYSIGSIVQGLYDAALLHCGIAAHVELNSIMIDNNVFGRILPNDVKLLITPTSLGLTIEKITNCAVKSAVVRMALADIRNAVLNLNDFGMFCYRSIEILMQDYKESDYEESKDAWSKMRSALKFEKSYVQPIVDLSVKSRHGNIVRVQPTQAKNLISRAVILLGRYCRVRVMGSNIDQEVILQ